ncbi:MAG: hypothetical protein AAGH15_05910 [Myxococcota bacterium]
MLLLIFPLAAVEAERWGDMTLVWGLAAAFTGVATGASFALKRRFRQVPLSLLMRRLTGT